MFALLGPWTSMASGVWSFATSRIGNILIASTIAYGVAYFQEEHSWKLSVSAEKAAMQVAHAEELSRETTASSEIAAAATTRVEETEATVISMQHQIDLLKSLEPINVPSLHNPSCALDAAFANSVRQFDAAGHRKGASPGRSR